MKPPSPAADRPAAAVLAIAVLAAAAFLPPLAAETPEEKGYAVAARAERSDRGFGSSEVSLEMVLRNRAGKEARRSLTIRTLEVPDEDAGDVSLVVFNSPPDVAGTGLLSHAKILEPDDQWLYLPALKRVKRISSVNKSGPFVGSEFAFEDFTASELGKFTYRYLGEEPCGELRCDVVERLPRYQHSGYSRQRAWIDREVYQVRKVEFYDRKGALLKTLTLDDYRRYDGGFWRPHRLSMTNHVSGKSTELLYGDYAFDRGLGPADFSRAALERLR
ncbi:MAG: outer membrane lipoprotein-sorting protein [Acidobacteria bacterium]|nr:MAG: outer membrane lipoprotein-sorting protein [Acidobacteriota bacterium]